MYRQVIKPILFSLTIERAHRAVLMLLRIIGWIPGGRWLLGKCYAVQHPALEREVFGIRFPNPVGLAAGFDRNGEVYRELSALGFGFIEVGTVTPRPQTGNPRPRVFRLPKDHAIINRIGLSNRGLERMIQHLRRPHEGVIVGCNIGKNTLTPAENAPNDYLKLFRNLYQYADYFTVNISCDNACHEGASHSREYILEVLGPLFDFRRGQNQYRPIMLKVSPDMTDDKIDEITDVLLSTPLDGIVATNGSHRREHLRTSRTTIEKIGSGRISGSPLTRRAVEIVRRIHTRSGGTYPIIGVGGLMNADDVRAMLDAGADLVQLYTGYIYEGPRMVGEVCRALIADAGQKAAAEAAAKETAEKEAADKEIAEKEAAEKEAAEKKAEKETAEPATSVPDAGSASAATAPQERTAPQKGTVSPEQAEAPTKPAAEIPSKAAEETQTKPAEGAPTMPAEEIPSIPAAETPLKAAEGAPPIPAAKTSTIPAAETPLKAAEGAPTKPAAETPTKPAEETPSMPAAKAPDQA